jgi:hypothetical protein
MASTKFIYFMRPVLLIFVSLSLVLQVQGAASLLSDCLNLGNACKMEMSAGSNCGCEHAGDLHMLPTASGDCPYGCLNCNLEAHAPDILLSLPSISRTALFNGALEAVLKMTVGEWSPDPLDVLSDAEIAAPPPHSPATEWGVWRL